VPKSSARVSSSSRCAPAIAMPIASSAAPSTQSASAACASSAAAEPSTAISANVRSPALARGLRSRSSPTSKPIAALVAKVNARPAPSMAPV
jgi:hypothetical protein